MDAVKGKFKPIAKSTPQDVDFSFAHAFIIFIIIMIIIILSLKIIILEVAEDLMMTMM
jgi:hypothetical protein